ncbi:transposase domain-containing protein [Plantactinospora sp. WMMB334]|uniref:transposase domain-containing protein n=1 Tax=Plantactinospora sp. WMMB334 TaxID=3404119 RepID=UPI003B940057
MGTSPAAPLHSASGPGKRTGGNTGTAPRADSTSAGIAITRSVTVAAGVFAPGHLGELTRLVPFDMVDEVLTATRRVQQRVRLLPARVVVYPLLAGCLFAELGYQQVWQQLTAGLTGLDLTEPTSSALRQAARQRLGPAPLRALFDLLRGPAATTTTRAIRWRGLLLTVIDGTVLTIADAPAVLARYPKQHCLSRRQPRREPSRRRASRGSCTRPWSG